MGSRPYPEVTAAVLPSSLRRFLSYTLALIAQLPVSVSGTGSARLALEAFLGLLSPPLGLLAQPLRSRPVLRLPDLPESQPVAPNVIVIGRGNLEKPSLHQKRVEVQEY